MLVSPPAHQHLAVSLAARAEREQVEARGSGLESTGDLGSDSDRVERLKLYDLVVQLYAPGTGHDNVHLLGALMLVRERLALPGLDAVVAEAGVLRVQRIFCES